MSSSQNALTITACVLALIAAFVSGSEDRSSLTSVAPAPTNCDDQQTIDNLKKHMDTLQNCVGDTPIYVKRPMNCTKLETIITCFNDYLGKVAHCYKPNQHMWNKTISKMEKVKEYLCEDNSQLLEEFYGGNGAECMKQDDVKRCNESLTMVLLNPSSYHDIVKFIFKYNGSHCENYTASNMCVVENLSRHPSLCSHKAAEIVDRVNMLFMGYGHGCDSETGGSSNVSLSASIVWILAVMVTSLVILTPS